MTHRKKYIIPFELVLVLLLLGIGCYEKNKSKSNILEKDIPTFEELKSNFEDPPAQYRTAPFWVWNGRVTKGKIDRQLNELKETGAGGAFIHARMGLITPYLSDHWNELYAYAVEKGRELGLKIYIYDEDNFPSGFAGGHLPAQMPEAVNQGHALTLVKSNTIPKDAAEDYYLVLKKTGDGFENVTDQLGGETGAGDYYLFKKVYYKTNDPWYGGFSYVDLLMDGVTEKFLDITMKGYIDKFGDAFGSEVPAIFSDEARARPDHDDSIEWTPGLFEKFRERWGYDLKNRLPSLFEEVGDWRKVRHDYYTLVGDLFIENWAKPYSKYAREHNLMWTGHHFEHAWPSPRNAGDWAATASWQQMPGIDVLFNQYSERLEGVDSQFGNARAVRELSSIANQMGRNRSISETYGASGWEFTFKDMKRIADWQLALGVNFLVQHHSMMTIQGVRKRDYPPTFSYHEPWWPHYKVLGDYCGRLSMALSAGEQRNNILVLVPTSSAWMYYTPRGVEMNDGFDKIGQSFQQFVNQMEAFQAEYDLGSERVIRDHGAVQGNKFKVGERNYDLVVLPPGLRNLNTHTADLIEQYVKGGGKMLSIGTKPEFIEGSKSNRIKQLQTQTDSKQWPEEKQLSRSVIDQYFQSEDFQISRSNIDSGKLFHRRMQLEDGEVLFLVNTSDSVRATGQVEMQGQSVVKLNAMNGDITSYPTEINNGKAQFSFDLPPVGSLLLFVGDKRNNGVMESSENAEVTDRSNEKVISPTDSPQTQPESPNVLVLDYVDLEVKGEKTEDIFYAKAADKAFKAYGFEHGNPWYRAIQYETNILDRNNFGEDTGFKAAFNFTIEGMDESAKAGLQAVIERPEVWDLSINGHSVQPEPGEWWLDRGYGVFNVGKFVQEGTNTVTITTSPMTVFSELERIFIRGDFNLKSSSEGWKMVPGKPIKLGSWKNQGRPFYSDEVTYIQHFEVKNVDQSNASYLVRLGDWKGTVAEVNINGTSAGIIGWPPYELDVSGLVNEGDNEISITVYGSLENLFGPHYGDAPNGRISPSDFGNAPEHQPPGNAYRTLDYGLMEPFKLIRKE